MKHRKDAGLRDLCAEVRPEDGIHPEVLKRQFRKQHQQRPPVDRHSLQYARAAHRCLEGNLAAITGDSTLADCRIDSVEPLPGGSVLLILVSVPGLTQDAMERMEARLREAPGPLRAAIAGSTRRKRVPHLRFRVVPAAG